MMEKENQDSINQMRIGERKKKMQEQSTNKEEQKDQRKVVLM
jgi:hypothetical protein